MAKRGSANSPEKIKSRLFRRSNRFYRSDLTFSARQIARIPIKSCRFPLQPDPAKAILVYYSDHEASKQEHGSFSESKSTFCLGPRRRSRCLVRSRDPRRGPEQLGWRPVTDCGPGLELRARRALAGARRLWGNPR